MKRPIRPLRWFAPGLLLFVLLILSGCAVGNAHDFDKVTLDAALASDQTVALTVQDARPDIVGGDKNPNFVGVTRGGFNNPFDTTTSSKRPLAEILRDQVTAMLEADGIAVQAVDALPAARIDDAVAKLVATQSERSIYLVIDEWHSDLGYSSYLEYGFVLSIFDAAGKILAEARERAEIDLTVGGFTALADAEEIALSTYKAALEKLFADPKIVAALQ